MERKEFDDMTKVLQLNEGIDKLYKHLCDLELQGKFMSDEYMECVDMIRFGSKRAQDYMLKYPLSNKDMNDFIEVLLELNHYNKWDPVNYIDKAPSIKIKRFIEHNFELSLAFHDSNEDEFLPDQIQIEDVTYNFEEGIALLEEEGQYDAIEDIQAMKAANDEQDKLDYFRDDLYLERISLEIHTFMKYLLDTINTEKDPEIKEALIRMKYQIISNVRSIELSFLYDPTLSYSLTTYQYRLARVFKKTPQLFIEHITDSATLIDAEQMQLLERGKKSYTDIDDKVHDILLGIMLQTHITCMPNEIVREATIEDTEAAVELSRSRADKKVLKKSLKINKKYIMQEYNVNDN